MNSKALSTIALGLLCGFVSIAAYVAGPASDSEIVVPLNVAAADRVAARATTGHHVHTHGAQSPEGGRHPSIYYVQDNSGLLIKASGQAPSAAQPVFYLGPGVTPPGLPSPGFYPDDMYQFTPPGPVVTTARTHNIYVDKTPDHWGNPGIFQQHLFSSSLIQVVDQYVGSHKEGRYTLGLSAIASYPVSVPLTDSGDIASIVHAAAAHFGAGYGHIYNVFLPKGADVCITATNCYSPDNATTWGTCSYHAFVDFADIGHVLYTVVPYQDDFAIAGGLPFYACDVGQADTTVNTSATPNGVLIDSTSHAISHELIDAITDPDGDAWLSLSYDTFYGLFSPGEVSDVCTNLSFLYTPFAVAGKIYYIAPAYSNKYHLCTTIP
jgi:hypothetical protein